MAGFDAPPRESDLDSQLPQLLILAGLVAAFGLFVVIFSRQQAQESAIATAQAAAGKESRPQTPLPVEPANAVLSPATILHPTQRKISASVPLPETLKPRFKELTVAKDIHQPVPAAVAEKPLIPVAAIEVSEKPPVEPPQSTEAELAANLSELAPVVGLDRNQAEAAIAAVRSIKSVSKRPRGPEEAVVALLPESMLAGLPFTENSDCELPESKARSLDKFSELLHTQVSLSDRNSGRHPRSSILSDRDQALAHALKKGRRWQTQDAVPAMWQILQVEPMPVRLQLVDMWAGHQTREATQALLNRAVFDLSPEVRQSANQALADRYQAGDRRQLLEALRYPWPNAAWHAAETLVALQDDQAVPALIHLLDAPDPGKPFRDRTGTHHVRETVRINHVQNCLLCHPPSRDKGDLVTRVVPSQTQTPVHTRIRVSPYQRTSPPQPDEVRVRADVTYLRPDFSVVHEPSGERFDYLVRTREATPEEIDALKTSDSSYPQRDAILSALRRLTGRDAGNQSEAWRRLKLKPSFEQSLTEVESVAGR